MENCKLFGLLAFWSLLAMLSVAYSWTHPVCASERALATEPWLDFAAELTFATDYRQRQTFGEETGDGSLELGAELQIEGFYRYSGSLSFFAEARAIAETRYRQSQEHWEGAEFIERGDTWLLWENISNSDFALQLGRQEFVEPRQWWWDEELDAARAHYRVAAWQAWLGLAKESAPRSTLENTIDPEADDIVRGLGQSTWQWRDDHRLDAFLLWQNDTSKAPSPDSPVKREQEDENDADLLWLGVRATGERALGSGSLAYWLESGWVWGDEINAEYAADDEDDALSRVESLQRQDVRGWAVDAGASWSLPLAGRPFVILGYARGSGDDAPDDGVDHAFRQTGLQDNEARFHYYGELLEPELSNLSILTAGAGLPLFEDSLLALVYHRYWQVETASFLRNAELEAQPNGASADIGQAVDVILKLEDSDDFQLQAVGAVFQAGRAFGGSTGERTYKLFLELTYEF